MNKKLWGIFGMFLVIGIVTATLSLSNFPDAYNDWRNARTSYNNTMNSVNPTIDWNSDKICEINKHGEPVCGAYINYHYTYDKQNYGEDNIWIGLWMGGSQTGDDIIADKFVEELIRKKHPMDKIIYIERNMDGVSIR